MHRRSPVFKSIAYSCVIVPGAPDVSIPYLFHLVARVRRSQVAFYAGITLRGSRPPASEASISEGAALVPATLQPEQGVIPYVLTEQTMPLNANLSHLSVPLLHRLREEEKLLEDKRRDIERKIAELQARTRNQRQE
jgi:hypothetical protein